MRKALPDCLILVIVSFMLPSASRAQSSFRTFVSALGNDSSPCTRPQPCRTFTRALVQTLAGGEINVLDTAGYGPFTIDKAISIVSEGVGVGVLSAAGGNAITISAGPNDIIRLQGLTIEGAHTGINGISFISGKSLTVSKSKIRDFGSNGISFTPNSTATLSVNDTIVENNAGQGILVQPSANISGCFAVFTHVKSDQNGLNGIDINGSAVTGFRVQASAFETTASLNGRNGFHAIGTASFGNVIFYLTKTHAAFNSSFGVLSEDNSFFFMAQNGLDSSDPATAPFQKTTNGHLATYGDNYGDGFGMTGTPSAKF